MTTATITRDEVLNTVFQFVDKSNAGDLVGAVDMHGPDSTYHMPGMPAMSYEAWKSFFYCYYQAFPDLMIHVKRTDAIIEGELLVGRYTFTGTHLGEFMGIPATGKSVNVSGVNIFRVRDGRIVEEWMYSDGVGLLMQLGLIPAPGANPEG